jgi:hypothetical protein
MAEAITAQTSLKSAFLRGVSVLTARCMGMILKATQD